MFPTSCSRVTAPKRRIFDSPEQQMRRSSRAVEQSQGDANDVSELAGSCYSTKQHIVKCGLSVVMWASLSCTWADFTAQLLCNQHIRDWLLFTVQLRSSKCLMEVQQ